VKLLLFGFGSLTLSNLTLGVSFFKYYGIAFVILTGVAGGLALELKFILRY